jgi:hypothetical protein
MNQVVANLSDFLGDETALDQLEASVEDHLGNLNACSFHRLQEKVNSQGREIESQRREFSHDIESQRREFRRDILELQTQLHEFRHKILGVETELSDKKSRLYARSLASAVDARVLALLPAISDIGVARSVNDFLIAGGLRAEVQDAESSLGMLPPLRQALSRLRNCALTTAHPDFFDLSPEALDECKRALPPDLRKDFNDVQVFLESLTKGTQ